MTLKIPATAGGKCLLTAVANADDAPIQDATKSRRRVRIVPVPTLYPSTLR